MFLRKIIRRTVEHWDLVILSILIISYIVVLGTLSILRHNAFASNYDLANMDQTVWNTLYGNFFSLSGSGHTISRFSIHADLILVLLSPLYLIWNDVRMLILSESFALGLGAIPVYFLALKILKSKLVGLVITLSYLLNPGMQWTDIYDFHGVSFAIPFLLSAFYFAYTKHWKWFSLFIFLALITKEEISLYVAMLGLAIFFVMKEKKVGILTFLSGMLWFILMFFMIIPYFSESGRHWALNWYGEPNQAIEKTTSSYLSDPKELLAKFTDKSIVEDYYKILLKPFGYLPLLGLPWLLLSLPELAINVLSTHAQMRSVFLHYDSGITPSLVIATIFGIHYLTSGISRFKKAAKFKKILLYGSSVILLIFALRVNYNYSPLPTTPSCWCWQYTVAKEDREFEAILKTIPPNASITASGNVRPHLTHRVNAFTLPEAFETTDYVAILTQERIIGGFNSIDTTFVDQLSVSPEHELVSNIGQFYLFKKK